MASMNDPKNRPAFIDIIGKQEDQTRAFDILEIRQPTVEFSENKVVAFGLGDRKLEPDMNFTWTGIPQSLHLIFILFSIVFF